MSKVPARSQLPEMRSCAPRSAVAINGTALSPSEGIQIHTLCDLKRATLALVGRAEESSMNRRQLIALLGGAAVATREQQGRSVSEVPPTLLTLADQVME